MYLKSDGSVWATGENSKGQLGDGTTTNRSNPVQVLKMRMVVDSVEIIRISAGANHTVYLKSNGSVWTTGANSKGQLGDSTTTDRLNPVQVKHADGSGS